MHQTQQVAGTYQYSESTATLGFAPASGHYTVPKDYWVNAKYDVSATSSVKSASGTDLTPYAHTMYGAQVLPAWEDKSDFKWWGANGISNYEFPFTSNPDFYSGSATVVLYPQIELAPEWTRPWWIDPYLPIAMKVTYTAENPAHKLYLRFNCLDYWSYGWETVIGPIDSNTEFSLEDLWADGHISSKELFDVANIDLLASSVNPFTVQEAETSLLTVSKIELLVPQDLEGWVDITTLPGQDYVTMDGWYVQYGLLNDDGTYTTVPNEGPWLNLTTNGGLYLPDHLPTKLRVTYTADRDLADPTLMVMFDGVDPIECISGEPIDIDTWVYDLSGYKKGDYYNTLNLQMWPRDFNGAWDSLAQEYASWNITKIEVFQKIPMMTEFYRYSSLDNQSPETVDIVIPGVLEITRDIEGGGIYNLALENSYASVGDYGPEQTSPAGTLWAFEGFNGNPTGSSFSIANKNDLSFDVWSLACDGNPPSMVGYKAICHIVEQDIYILFRFTAWGQGESGGGEFGYERQIIVA